MARPPRNSTAMQMLVAMLVLLIPVIGLTVMFTRNPEPPVQAIDYQPLAEQAATEASFPVLVPANLPQDWVATRARWTPAGHLGVGGDPVPGDTWQLGFLSPQQDYLALDQRDAAVEVFVDAVTRSGRADGESSVTGKTWQRYASADGRTRSLVLREGESVAIVSGDVPYAALEAFAATLVPA